MGVKWSISVPTASPARAVKKACTHACEQDSKIRAVTRKVSSKQQAPTMAQPPCQASAEKMAAHDRQAWRTLDMADIQQRIQERAEHTQAPIPDDGIQYCPLACRRIWQCRHHYSLFDMLMNTDEPISDEALATRACPTCTMGIAIHAMVEVQEDHDTANYSDA